MNTAGTRLVLIGAGGHGKVVADAARGGGWSEIVFLDRSYPERRENGVWPIVGSMTEISGLRAAGAALFLSIGDNTTRARLWTELGMTESPTLIDPDAHVSAHARLGLGTLVVRGAAVNADVHVGRGVIINTGATVDHDCSLADFVHVSPGANLSGAVTVGTRSWIGVGSAVREGIAIGTDVRVGAGAAVVADVPDGLTMVGVPARPFTITRGFSGC